MSITTGQASRHAPHRVEAAQSQADDAKAKYELQKTLAQDGMIAAEELRTAETTRRTAEALAATARADQRAAEAAQRYAALRPTDASGHYNAGVLLAQLGQSEAATRAMRVSKRPRGW